MVFCPQCGAENPDNARFCDQCGVELLSVGESAVPPSPAPPDAEAGEQSSGGPTTCPQCHAAVIPGEAFCDNCGAPLFGPPSSSPSPSPTGAAPQPAFPPPQAVYPPPQPVGGEAAGSSAPSAPSIEPTYQVPPMAPPAPTPAAPHASAASRSLASVHLVLSDHNTTLPLPEAGQATVGRADPVSKFTPDIDLTSFDGLKSGVGRRHARFQMQNQQITIEDLDSTNGTFLNGRKLAPHTPYPLNNGDNLSLGNMAIIVFIENMA